MKDTVTLAVLTGLLSSGCAFAGEMTNPHYIFLEKTIEMEYWSAEASCHSTVGKADRLCLAIAMGNVRIAKAELDAAYAPSDINRLEARMVVADAHYEIAVEQCAVLAATAREACEKAAGVARSQAFLIAIEQVMASQPAGLAGDKCRLLLPDARASCLKDALAGSPR